MNNLTITFAMLILLITSSCNSYKNHVTNDYYKHSSPNMEIAIVPVRFTLSGVVTNKMDSETLLQQEDIESKRFQLEISDRIVRKMGRRKSKIAINLQDINTTNSKLKDVGYSIHDSYKLSPNEMTKILGVDAVVIVNIRSNQFLSNFEAQVISTGTHVIEAVFGGNENIIVGGIPTGEIQTNATIVDKNDNLLWSSGKRLNSRVQKTPTKTIIQTTKKIVRNFPFRNQDFQ